MYNRRIFSHDYRKAHVPNYCPVPDKSADFRVDPVVGLLIELGTG